MAKTLLMLNVGDKVRDPESLCLGEPVAWQVADLLHQGYPAGSVTLCSQHQVALYAFDGSEPENENIDRQAQGNNRYSLSNIRSWLNSESLSGWYAPAHEADAPPKAGAVSANPYALAPGFMGGLSEGFRKAVQPTELVVAKCAADGGGSETVTDRFFLPSNTEIGVANQNGIAEGARLALFTNDAARQRCVSASAAAGSTYEDTPYAETQPWPWRTRTPVANTAGQVCTVLSSGQGNVSFPANQGGSIGLVVCCSLPGSTRVSDEPDGEGYYTLLFDAPPPRKAGDLLAGDLLRVRLGGKDRLMAVVQQGKPSALYSEECDGAWCMALDGVEAESMPAEMYSGAPGGKLDQKYACMADFTLRPYIRRAKLPHISSTGNAVSSGANGYAASCFLLSAIEAGISQTYKDGAVLAFFTGAGAAQRRICRVDGEPADWFTRTMYYSSGWRKHFVKANGALGNYTSSAAVSHIVRPCFILGPETPLREGRGEDGSWRPAAQRGTVSLKELSVFDKIKDPDSRYLGSPIIWQVAGINHEGHPAGSVTILSQRLLCAKPFDGAEPGMPNGNPRYGYSNIRQWLCSAAGPGQWYMPQHVSDGPPAGANVYAPYGNAYDGEAGFMHGLSPSFRSALLPMAVTTDLGAGASQTELLRDRLCLPSPTELGLGNLPAEEGAPLAIFQNAWNRERCFTPEGLAANASSSKPADSETPWRFWLRASANTAAVYQANAQSYTNEPPWYGQAGVLPMGCLPGDLTVSNMQDEDGCFVLVFNQRPDAPQISSPQADQRVKTSFYLEFLPAADAEGDMQFFQAEVTPDPSFSSGVVRFTEGLEKWDGTDWQPAQAAGEDDAGALFRLPIAGLPLNADLYARVSATDQAGSSYAAYSGIVPLRTGDILEFKTLPARRAQRPRYVFPLLSASIDSQARIKILACNNGDDALPAWEDCTEAYEKRETWQFQNQHKSAEQWAVRLHITIEALAATGEISVRAVGLGLS